MSRVTRPSIVPHGCSNSPSPSPDWHDGHLLHFRDATIIVVAARPLTSLTQAKSEHFLVLCGRGKRMGVAPRYNPIHFGPAALVAVIVIRGGRRSHSIQSSPTDNASNKPAGGHALPKWSPKNKIEPP